MSENRGIPTLYAGTRFRSRLEARWAAFFDLAGWRWEYEPIDLSGWIPDFLVTFKKGDGNGTSRALVEVKPVIAFDKTVEATAEKIERAKPPYPVWILGATAPIEHKNLHSALGWNFIYDESDAHFHGECDEADVAAPYFYWKGGRWLGTFKYGALTYGEANKDLLIKRWRRAGNEVQWRARSEQLPNGLVASPNRKLGTWGRPV